MHKKVISLDTFLEIERQNFEWRKRALRHLLEHHRLDLIVQYSVMMDTINHKFRSLIEGYQAADDAVRREAMAFERAVYGVVDDFVGGVRELLGEEAAILVVSDHGSCGYSRPFSIRETLKKAGLLVTRQTPAGEEIDWTASRAVPIHCSYVCVNLEGREPAGIVPPGDYDRTVDQIIAALYDAADPDTGKRMVALALRREDARLVGLGGENLGDVVFAVAGGIGSPGGGVHAGQIPTARSRGGIQCALLLASGPGIRKGVRITRTVRQHDIAPTVSALLAIPTPRQAEGSAIREMLE
jgi:predicted AlkP superfamily phosphohydrolase/phosphomutase